MGTRISRAAIYDALNTYQVPGTSATLVALKAVRGIDVLNWFMVVLLVKS